MSIQTYDPKDVNVTVDGNIITGFSEDGFIKVEKNEDNFTPYVGAQGEVSFSNSADKTGKITVTVQSSSPSFLVLNKLSAQNKTYPVSVSDLNTGMVVGGTDCRIMKPAAFEAGKEISEREFEIFVSTLTYSYK
jgi:archaellum component FlaG (FlaF/FlaG flagellin family)